MATDDPSSSSTKSPAQQNALPDPNHSSAIRIAGVYLVLGLLWIGLSDLSLAWSSGLTADGYFESARKGAGFVLVSSGLVYWLCRREYRSMLRNATLLRAVVEGTSDAVYIKDRDGRHLLVNEAAARFLGRPVSEVIGRGAHELFESADAERLITSDRAIMAGGQVVTLEETLAADGVSRVYHATKAPYRDARGALIGIVGISRDITDRKREETVLRQSEERFRQLVDAVPQIVCTAGLDGHVTSMNAEGVSYLGLAAGQLTGWSWESVIHPDDLDHAKKQWSSILSEGSPRPVEMRVRRADGKFRWHISHQKPIRNASGEILSWVGTNTDIDDLKQAETALRDTEARLHEAQRIARLGSWSWEPSTNAVWWSDAEFELFGVCREDVTPSFEAFLAMLHPDDRHIAVSRVEAMMAGDDEFANDFRIIRPDGACILIHSRARATRDALGAIVRVEGTDQDITDRWLAEGAQRESEMRLQAAVEVAGLGVIVIDYDRNTAELSQRAAEQFGLSRNKPISRAELHERFHPDDRDNLKRLTEQALDASGNGAFSLEHRVVRPDGSIRWLNVRKQVSFAAGRPQRAVVVTVDVTERRHDEARLLEQEMLAREAAELAKVGGWGFDPVTLKSDWTPEVAAIYGLDSKEAPPVLDAFNFFNPEDRPALEAALAAAILTGTPHDMELQLTTAAGEKKWVRTICRPIVEGNRVVRVRGSLQDITDRKRSETELRASEERYRLLFESNPHPMWVFDVDSLRFLEVNNAAVQSYGYSRDEFLAMTIRDIRPAEEVSKLVSVVAQTNNGLRRSGEWKHRRKDGTLFDVDVSSHNLPQEPARSRLVLALDITDRKRAEGELLASERRLRLALEAAGAISFTWDVKGDIVTRYFSTEPALPVTSERLGTLAEVCERVHPDDRARFEARVFECLAAGTEYRNEYRVVRPDGTIACLEDFGFLDRAADGSPRLLTGMSIDITERVAVSEALRASDERFQKAAQVVGFGVFEHDHVREQYYWSPRIKEIFGYESSAQLDLKMYLSLIHPDDREAITAAVQRAHDPTGDGRYDVVYRLIRQADQRVLWLKTQSKTHFDGEGPNRRLVRTVGATVDITDSKLAAEALSLSEARYRQLADMLPTAIFVHADNTILYGNPAFIQLLGAHDENEVLGRSPFDIVHPSSHDALRQYQHEMQSGSTNPGCEMRAVRCDGRSLPVHMIAAPISGYGRQATLVAFSDLTERERTTALLRSVLDSVGDAILTIDASGTIASANLATERLFGYTEQNLIGGNFSVLMPEPHDWNHDRYEAEYARSGVPHVVGAGRELDARRKDGSTFPAELTVTEFSRDGERHFTGVLRDITARRQLEDQFRQAQKMEAVGRLAGGVAHDFNNLLTVINGYSEILIAGITADSPTWRPLVAILDAGERAARLTRQLLAFSRKSVVEPRLVDLNELVAEATSLLRRLIGEDIALSVITTMAPVRVMIDPGQLEQVLMNLAVNARDAMPTGGELSIETRAVECGAQANRLHPDLQAGSYVSLRVADTGCGMTSEVRDKIFEPFFTTKGIGKGTGLGLAVVHGVVQQSGGAIAVESTVGVGTAFTVFLPAAADTDSSEALNITRVAPMGSETVLVVEDEDAVRTLVHDALEGKGYTVLSASSGKEALELLSGYSDAVDLMVTDVIMPGLSGREVAEAVRSSRPELRVLYMSGYTYEALDRHGLQGTDDQFIQKPFTTLSLARRVSEILHRSCES